MKAGDYIKRAMPFKKIILKFFILFFAINASFCILPSGIILSYGLFGEVTSFFSLKNQESGIQSTPIRSDLNKRYKIRINNEQQKVQYEWFVLIITILTILYLQYWLIFSRHITPVVLKVRMNN